MESYTEEQLGFADAMLLEEEIAAIIGKKYSNGGSLAYQATYNLSLALSLFEEEPDIALFVRMYFNTHTKGGYVAVDIRGIVEFPFNRLGQDDALAVCRAFLCAYHNHKKYVNDSPFGSEV